MTFGNFMTVCMREYTPALLPEVAKLCIDVLYGDLTVSCMLHLVRIHHVLLQRYTMSDNLQYNQLVLEGVALFFR